MKQITSLLYFIFIISISLDAQSQDFQIDSLNSYIEKLIADYNVPGLSVAIVSNDSLLISKGYGLKSIEKNDFVDNNTLFGIGSISKSFTALALGMLVSDGKIDWDDKVTDYLPYFQLYDPFVTNAFTIRDLLTHRSGLKDVSGGILWYHSDLSRREIIERIKYLEPISGFREKPAYQNIMYLVAGEVVAEVSGSSWDNFIRTRIFKPLGMINSVTSHAEREKSSNIALPHIDNDEGKKIVIQQEKGDNLAAAGFIYSTSNDMAKYMRFYLNNGIVDKDTLVSKEALKEIFKPQIIYPIYGPPLQNEFTSYGFGWWLTPLDGHKIVEHSGGIDGMSANLIMISDLDFGIIVLTNTSSAAIITLTFNVIGKKLNNQPIISLSNKIKMYVDQGERRKQEAKQKRIDSRVLNTKHSLSIEKYAGTYYDEMYGNIFVKFMNDTLNIEFTHTKLFSGKLSHWHYDTFKVDWIDPRVSDGFISFVLDSKGEIVELKIDQANLLDVDFSELKILKNKK